MVQHNSYKITAGFFANITKLILKFIQNFKGPRMAKTIFEIEEQR